MFLFHGHGWKAAWLCVLEVPRSVAISGSGRIHAAANYPALCAMCVRPASCPCTACGVSDAPALQVSLLPTIDGRLFRLARGNAQLPRALLAGCGANETRARVAEVARQRDGSYTLTLAPPEGSPDEEVCCVRASRSWTGVALCVCGVGSRGDACNSKQTPSSGRPSAATCGPGCAPLGWFALGALAGAGAPTS